MAKKLEIQNDAPSTAAVPRKFRNWRLFLLFCVLCGSYIWMCQFSDYFMDKFLRDRLDLSKAKAPNITKAMRQNILKDLLRCKDRPLLSETVRYRNFWLRRNFIRGDLSQKMGCAESITYTTHGDYTLFGSLPSVVVRWLAPVSFALYAPGYDMHAAMDAIQYLRNCLPESNLIQLFVTFHLYFPEDHMPESTPITEDDILGWPYDCKVKWAPYQNVNYSGMYKTLKQLRYPINVGRNIARHSVNTYFILASDIELQPSRDLVEQFLDMVARNGRVLFDGKAPRVFPMPLFEVQDNVKLPAAKQELLKLLQNKLAKPFQAELFDKMPNQMEWLNATKMSELRVLSVSKREDVFRLWSPFYISNNREPMFDERVLGEAKLHRRIQSYAMCLIGYEFHMLHPAFLIHRPAIKIADEEATHKDYESPMLTFISAKIQPEYTELYGTNSKCQV